MLLPIRNKNDKLDKHLELEDKLISLFENEELNIEELMNIIRQFQVLRKNKTEIKVPLLLKEKKLEESLLNSYENAKKEILSLYKLNFPVLNISTIKDFLLEFSKLAKDSVTFPNTEDINNIVITTKEENISLRFKNGKKTILTDRNFDLSEFNSEELVEILRFLDTIVKDNSYDYLRGEIAKEIASISSFSVIKE